MLFADMGHRTDRNPLRLSPLGRDWAGDDGSMGLDGARVITSDDISPVEMVSEAMVSEAKVSEAKA